MIALNFIFHFFSLYKHLILNLNIAFSKLAVNYNICKMLRKIRRYAMHVDAQL